MDRLTDSKSLTAHSFLLAEERMKAMKEAMEDLEEEHREREKKTGQGSAAQ